MSPEVFNKLTGINMSGYSGSTTPSWADYDNRYKEDIPSIKDFPGSWTKEESEQFKPKSESGKTSWYETAKQDLFRKASDTRDRKSSYDRNELGARFGDPVKGSGGEIFQGLGYLNAPQHAPFFTPGISGGGTDGLFGDIGTAAGTLGTLAGVFGPLGAPIGALAGKFIDRAVG
jgi:hypothetical protein